MAAVFLALCAMTTTAKADVAAPGEVRDRLTAEILKHGRQATDQMVHNGWFMAVGAASAGDPHGGF